LRLNNLYKYYIANDKLEKEEIDFSVKGERIYFEDNTLIFLHQLGCPIIDLDAMKKTKSRLEWCVYSFNRNLTKGIIKSILREVLNANNRNS